MDEVFQGENRVGSGKKTGVYMREGAAEPHASWCVTLRESCEFGGFLGLGVWTEDLLEVGCEKLCHLV